MTACPTAPPASRGARRFALARRRARGASKHTARRRCSRACAIPPQAGPRGPGPRRRPRRADCTRPMGRSWPLGRHGRMRLGRAGLRPASSRPGHLADDVLAIRLDGDAAARVVVLVEFPNCPASCGRVSQRNGNTPVHFQAEQRLTDETLGRLRRIMRRRARTGRQEDRRGQPGQPERARWHPVWPR